MIPLRPTIVHSYSRFSHEDQADGDSLRRQAKSAEEFCHQHNHTLSDVRMSDEAASAFRGRKQKQLESLLRIIVDPKDQRIEAGHILYVEAIDRLSRKGIRPTRKLVDSILDAGVHIAISLPLEKVYRADDDNDLSGAIELTAFAYQAYIYSKSLSDRIKSSWKHNRSLQESGQKLGGVAPCWLTYQDNRFEPDGRKVATIRFVFQRAIEGMGCKAICREMNERYAPIAKSTQWNETFIRDLIRNWQVLGEHQRHEMDENDRRIPVGGPICGYYPAIIDENTWLAANAALDNRRIERGPSGNYINLFTGLLWHAVDGCPAHICTYQQKRADGTKVTYRRLKSYAAQSGVKAASTATVDAAFFERAVLSYLREIKSSDFDADNNDTEVAIKAKWGELNRNKRRLQELQSALAADDAPVSVLVEAVNKVQGEIYTLKKQVDSLTAEAHRNAGQCLEHVKSLIQFAESRLNRQRLREAIKQIIEQIRIWTHKTGPKRRDPVACFVEIVFKSGKRRYMFLMNGKADAVDEEARELNPNGEMDSETIAEIFLHLVDKQLGSHFALGTTVSLG